MGGVALAFFINTDSQKEIRLYDIKVKTYEGLIRLCDTSLKLIKTF